MKSVFAKKITSFLLVAIILINPLQLRAQENTSAGSFDESLQDLTLVMGAGAVGAVLGLSTLSFVDKPKDHFKNVAIGGAIGIVIGVGIVIFGQATKPQAIVELTPPKMTPESSESYARLDFSKQKIAESYFQEPTVGYNFTF